MANVLFLISLQDMKKERIFAADKMWKDLPACNHLKKC